MDIGGVLGPKVAGLSGQWLALHGFTAVPNGIVVVDSWGRRVGLVMRDGGG